MRNGCQWLAVALLMAGCVGGPGGQATRSTEGDSASLDARGPAAPELPVGRMTAAEARTFLASHREALVLDVRNPDEWNDEHGHIDGARQIPLPELAARAGEIEGWKEKPVVIVCRSGRRSQTAAEMLAGLGYLQVFNLEGGMIAWRETEAAKR